MNDEDPYRTNLFEAGETANLGSASNITEGSIIDNFRVHRLIGEGAFGLVFAAIDLNTDRQVALKVLKSDRFDSSTISSFRSEAKKAANLEHKNIVKIHQVKFQSEGPSYIVMGLVDGRSLASIIDKDGPLPVDISLSIAIDLGKALALAHANGVYHLDVKPANIIIALEGHAVLTDFGLAIHESERWLTGRCGTPAYLAPEQVRSQGREYDGRTDIWALGVVLYEMATKRRPFVGSGGTNSLSELFTDICDVSPKPPSQWIPELTQAFDELCLRCIEKRKEDRFGSASLFVGAAKKVLESPKSGSTDESNFEPLNAAGGPEKMEKEETAKGEIGKGCILIAAIAATIFVSAIGISKRGHLQKVIKALIQLR